MSVILPADLDNLLTRARAILNQTNPTPTAEQIAFVSTVFETVRRVEDQTTLASLQTQITTLQEQVGVPAHKVGSIKYGLNIADHDGWLLMNGRTLSRVIYSALFNTHPSFASTGDLINTFDIPNVSGRFLLAAGQGAGLTLRNLFDVGGEENHTLSGAEAGFLSINTSSDDGDTQVATLRSMYSLTINGTTWNEGDGSQRNVFPQGQQSHNNMGPYQAFNVFLFSGVI